MQTNSSQVQPQGRKKREQHLSLVGKWRSFPRVPNLLQYVSSGIYFGKVKINGKKVRTSLETDVWSEAVRKLPDFLKINRLKGSKTQAPKFKDATERFKQELSNDASIKLRSKEYRLLFRHGTVYLLLRRPCHGTAKSLLTRDEGEVQRFIQYPPNYNAAAGDIPGKSS